MMYGKKIVFNTVKKGIKIFKSLSNNDFFKISGHAVKAIALLAVLGAVGSLELEHISLNYALIQSIPALIVLVR